MLICIAGVSNASLKREAIRNGPRYQKRLTFLNQKKGSNLHLGLTKKRLKKDDTENAQIFKIKLAVNNC